MHHKRRALLTLIFLMLAILVFAIRRAKTDVGGRDTFDPDADLLAYTLFSYNAGKTSLMLYDPRSEASTLVLDDVDFRHFSFSIDGRLAFASTQEGITQIYVLDMLAAKSTPTNISQDPATNDYPLRWSPDGRYLAFESYQEADDKQLFVRDGKRVVNITPDDMLDTAEGYSVRWSSDGRLAIRAYYGSSSTDYRSEIYLWDGHTTTNLSQNPTGVDRNPTWSADGRLAFLSEWNGEYEVFVWDGVSVKNGSPDRDSFTNVAPDLTAYYSYPTWTNTGQLAFVTTPPEEHRAQVLIWDGQTATNISQNPDLHNGSPRWSENGDWTFSTFLSPRQVLYVRDANNDPLVTIEGGYSPAWSASGDFVFCQRAEDPTRADWVLALWDGQQVVELAKGYEIWAHWQSGSGVVCSNG